MILSLALEQGARLGSSGTDLGRYVTVVVVLIAALAGAGLLLRRMVAGSVRARAAKRSLAVVDVLPLGGKRQLAVVRVYDRTFALGLGDKEVSLVAELDPDAAARESDERDGASFERLFDLARARLAQRRRGEEPAPVRTEELVG